MQSLCEKQFLNMIATVVLTLLLVHPFLLFPSMATGTDTCEYDLDLASQKVKIVCQGSPSMINVYVNNALMKVDEYDTGNDFRENTYDEHATKVNKQREKSTSGTLDNEARQPETVQITPGNSEQQREAPERLRFPEGHHKGESLSAQRDGEEIVSRHDGWFSGLILEVGERMQKTKQNLSNCAESIKNVLDHLSHGDVNLRPDTDNLKRPDHSAKDLTEGVIKALRNQFNFMSDAFLSRSYELQKLASAMTMLVDVTNDGLNTSLTAHKRVTDEVSILEAYLAKLRKKVSKGISRHGKFQRQEVKVKADQCPKEISAIGMGTMRNVQWATGSFMAESANPGHRRSIFIMADAGPATQLREYYTELEFEYDLVGRYLTLPVSCSGTGHVVYRHHFYCHKTDSNLIVKYHLKKTEIVSMLALPGAKYTNSLPYTSEANTDIDLAVDELGLWAIYETDASDGRMVITKIDPRKMENLQTWNTSFAKKDIGNAFMICGVLYATNSTIDTPTFIRYVFNTESDMGQVLEEGALSFANSAFLGLNDGTAIPVEEKSSNSVMLSYDFRKSCLYSWNNGRVEEFPVYFKQ